MVTIEVPGLAEALNRQPATVVLRLARRSGAVRIASVKVPDERSALILKVMAWDARRAGKDAVDVWRCVEIALAAALGPDDLASDREFGHYELRFSRARAGGGGRRRIN